MLAQNKKKRIAITARFGVALAVVYAPFEIQAEILDLTYNGGDDLATSPFSSMTNGAPTTHRIDQVAGVNGFAQWNDLFEVTGRTFALFTSLASPGLVSVAEVYNGQVLSPATFVGSNAGDGTQFDGSGSAFIGFRSAAGNVGWFRIDFTQAGPIHYSGGQYASMGESVTVGGITEIRVGDVNCDAAINLLDVQPFIETMMAGKFDVKADLNSDGTISLLDVRPLIELIIANN